MMEKPEVESIEGLSPAIAIEQKSTSHNPRSTVGTITEIYDYLRLLFARVGEPYCPEHLICLSAQTISQMVDQVLALPPDSRLMLLAPVIKGRKGEHIQVLETLKQQGFIRARIDGQVVLLEEVPALDLRRKHTIEVVIDRFKVREDIRLRLSESFETALRLGEGLAQVYFLDEDKPAVLFSAHFSCPECGYSLSELEPRLFSFNNPLGACPECDGLGIKQFFDPAKVVDAQSSLIDGAIRGWDKRNAFYFQILEALQAHYHFDMYLPFAELSETIQQIILQGSGDTAINFVNYTDKGTTFTRKKPFEGVIPN
jgi:excinuclease ABC subunit A